MVAKSDADPAIFPGHSDAKSAKKLGVKIMYTRLGSRSGAHGRTAYNIFEGCGREPAKIFFLLSPLNRIYNCDFRRVN